MYTVKEIREALAPFDENLEIVVSSDPHDGISMIINEVIYESRGPQLIISFEKPPIEDETEDDDVVITCPHCGKEV